MWPPATRRQRSRDTLRYGSDPSDAAWAVQRARYMTLKTIAPPGDDPHIMLPLVAA